MMRNVKYKYRLNIQLNINFYLLKIYDGLFATDVMCGVSDIYIYCLDGEDGVNYQKKIVCRHRTRAILHYCTRNYVDHFLFRTALHSAGRPGSERVPISLLCLFIDHNNQTQANLFC